MKHGKYIDGYVLIVSKKNVVAYRKVAKDAGKIWKECGALEYVECMGNDLIPKVEGAQQLLTFPKIIKAKPDDTVWFSFVTYKNKKHRDQVNKKVHAYMTKKYGAMNPKDIPFDMKKLAYGGFTVEVNI